MSDRPGKAYRTQAQGQSIQYVHSRGTTQSTDRHMAPAVTEVVSPKQLYEENKMYLKHIEYLTSELEKSKNRFEEEKLTKEGALRRLSQVAGNKLKDGNPAITDLGDANRPSKLGEKLSSLYTEEWMDAYESIPNDPKLKKSKDSERKICEILLKIFLACFKICCETSHDQFNQMKKAAWDFSMRMHLDLIDEPKQNVAGVGSQSLQMSPTGSSNQLNFNTSFHGKQQEFNKPIKAGVTVPYDNTVCDDIIQLGKDRRKQDNSHVNDKIKTKCLEDIKKQKYPIELTKEIQVYICKCAELCWKMCVQDPPMTILVDVKSGTVIDKEFKQYFSIYSKSGKHVDFVVWPAILLHENGPLISKGVVQGY